MDRTLAKRSVEIPVHRYLGHRGGETPRDLRPPRSLGGRKGFPFYCSAFRTGTRNPRGRAGAVSDSPRGRDQVPVEMLRRSGGWCSQPLETLEAFRRGKTGPAVESCLDHPNRNPGEPVKAYSPLVRRSGWKKVCRAPVTRTKPFAPRWRRRWGDWRRPRASSALRDTACRIPLMTGRGISG